MVFLSIIGCCIILVFLWFQLRDIIAPPFILSVVWLLAYITLLSRADTVDLGSIYYLSFFLGLCFFILGFFCIVKNKNKKSCGSLIEKQSDLILNPLYIKIILVITATLFTVHLTYAVTFIARNFDFNFWKTIAQGMRDGTYNELTIIRYSRNAIGALSIICSILYFSNPSTRNRKYFFFFLLIASALAVTAGNRGAIFVLVIAVFFCYMIIKSYKNRKVAILLSILAVLILAVFIGSSFLKFVYEDQSETMNFIARHLRVYFTTSMIAFVEWIEKFHDYSYGANTFRFFCALLNAVGYDDITVADNVQEFIWVYGDITNVYTVLHHYATDFGLAYALLIQFILGIIYGFLYKKTALTSKLNIFYVALLSFLYFPLINQFFDDKYFSVSSNWIQITFWLYFFTRCGLIKRRSNVS